MNDLISRQAAIEVLRNRWLKTRNYEGIGEDIAEECEIYLKTLPSAQPERPKGHWIFVHPLQENDSGAYMCSECRTGDWDIDPVKDKFCGADMKGDQNE